MSIPEIRNPERDRRPSEAFKIWLSARASSCQGAGLAISRYCTPFNLKGNRISEYRRLPGDISSRNGIHSQCAALLCSLLPTGVLIALREVGLRVDLEALGSCLPWLVFVRSPAQRRGFFCYRPPTNSITTFTRYYS